jgi:hypothetical protein
MKTKMKQLAVALGLFMGGYSLYASFEVIAGSTKLGGGAFNKIWCSTGVTCSRVGDKLKIVTNAAVVGDITMDSAELISNAVDDTIEVKSNDEHTTLRVEGYEAKNSILELAADDGDDTGDKYYLKSDTSNVFTIGNGSTDLTTLTTVGDWTYGGTTPYLTVGDNGAEDSGLVLDGSAANWNISHDETAAKLVVGLGTTAGTTNRMAFDSADLNIWLGDASAADMGLIFDGNAQDFNISMDDSVDKLVIGLGSVAGTTNRMAFNSADLNIVLGDASTADMGLVFDGNAQDYNISLDDSTDDLVIGLGSAAGTTDAMRIDENQVVTFLQDPAFQGTTPYVTVGDNGAEDSGIVFDGAAGNWNISHDETASSLVIGVGTAAGTTDAIRINTSQVATFLADPIFAGTTPNVTVGDAGAEDAQVTFDGNAQDFHVGLDDSSDKLVIGLGSALGTTSRMTFNSADLDVILGDATAADVSLVFDGNAQDFHVGLDDSTDDLVIGLGTAPGTTDAMRIDENQIVTFVQEVLGLGTDTLSGFLQKQTASTTTTITAVQCGQTFVSNSADTLALPEASSVLGCRLTFVCGTADDFHIDTDGTDAIGGVSVITGSNTTAVLAPSAGDRIMCTDIGSSVVLEAVGANLWASIGAAGGVWTDAN